MRTTLTENAIIRMICERPVAKNIRVFVLRGDSQVPLGDGVIIISNKPYDLNTIRKTASLSRF